MTIKQLKKELGISNKDIASFFDMTLEVYQNSTAKKRYENALCEFYECINNNKKMNTVYFQPKGIDPKYCEAGMISKTDPEYIWYLDEPCKILISEVKIIDKANVRFNKKNRIWYVIKPKKTCSCKIPNPKIKVSENGIDNYCANCCKSYKNK